MKEIFPEMNWIREKGTKNLVSYQYNAKKMPGALVKPQRGTKLQESRNGRSDKKTNVLFNKSLHSEVTVQASEHWYKYNSTVLKQLYIYKYYNK